MGPYFTECLPSGQKLGKFVDPCGGEHNTTTAAHS